MYNTIEAFYFDNLLRVDFYIIYFTLLTTMTVTIILIFTITISTQLKNFYFLGNTKLDGLILFRTYKNRFVDSVWKEWILGSKFDEKFDDYCSDEDVKLKLILMHITFFSLILYSGSIIRFYENIEIFVSGVPINFIISFDEIALIIILWSLITISSKINFHFSKYIQMKEIIILWMLLFSMFFSVRSNDIMTLSISPELVSFCLYICSSLLSIEKCTKSGYSAAVYYFKYGLFASCLFLSGLSLIYSQMGVWRLNDIYDPINSEFCRLINFKESILEYPFYTEVSPVNRMDGGVSLDSEVDSRNFPRNDKSMPEDVDATEDPSVQTPSYTFIDSFVAVNTVDFFILFLGSVFIMINFLSKPSTLPFQLWILKVYTNVTSPVPRLSVLITKIFFLMIFPTKSYVFLKMFKILKVVLLVRGIVSLVIGTLGTVFQNNLRLSIAHGSVASIGVVCSILSLDKEESVSIIIAYFCIYTLGLFGFLCNMHVTRAVRTFEIEELFSASKKFFETHATLSITIKSYSFMLIGIPSFSSLINKVYIYMLSLSTDNFFIFISIFVSSISMAGYYLRLIRYGSGIDIISIESRRGYFFTFLLFRRYGFFFACLNIILIIAFVYNPVVSMGLLDTIRSYESGGLNKYIC